MADAVALDTRQAATLLIEFEDDAGACRVALEHNSEDGAGTFRVYHGGNEYAVYTNIPGSCTRIARNAPEAIEDVLQYAAASRAELSRVPSGMVRCGWVGKSGGNLTISGQTVRLAAAVHAGVLQAEYTTLYDRWVLPSGWSHYVTALAVVRCGDESVSVTLDPDDPDDPDDPASEATEGEAESLAFVATPSETNAEHYVIRVVDYCTGDPIPEANVNTAYGSGPTDGDGKIEIGPIPAGTRVDVQVTANGYKDSRTDSLNNEYFIA